MSDPIQMPKNTSRSPQLSAAAAALAALPGLASVKADIAALLDDILANASKPEGRRNWLLLFVGPAGSGKSTVAERLCDLLHEASVLSKGNIVFADRATLVAGYIGQTEHKTRAVCAQALDGVLFIDDAPLLAARGDATGKNAVDFAAEAVATLQSAMSANPGRMVVILATPRPRYAERLFAAYPELERRIDRTIAFPAYDVETMLTLLEQTAAKRGIDLPAEWRGAVAPWIAKKRTHEHWTNGREINSLLVTAQNSAAARRQTARGRDEGRLEISDFEAAFRRWQG